MVRRTLLLTVMVAGLLLAACGSGDEGGEMVWAVGGNDALEGGAYDRIAQMWNEENPDYPVRMEALPPSADEQRQQMALELNAEGNGLDILGLDVIWTGEFSENGWLASLEDRRDELEAAALPGPFESATWGGELWGAPTRTDASFLYYRTDLVDEPPTTWDELVEVGTRIAEEEGIAPFVGQGAQYEGMVVNYLEYLWSAGGDLYNEDQTEVLFGEGDAALRATEFMQEAQDSGFYAPGFNTMMEEEARNEFQAGNAVFMRNWPYAYSIMEADDSPIAGKFAIAPLPTFDGEGTISALGGTNNAVNAYSDHVEAAKDFVVWVSTTEEVQLLLAEDSIPPAMDVYDQLADDPILSVLGEVLSEARPRPPAPEWNGISVEIQQNMFPAYNGDLDPQEAVEAVRDYLLGTIE